MLTEKGLAFQRNITRSIFNNNHLHKSGHSRSNGHSKHCGMRNEKTQLNSYVSFIKTIHLLTLALVHSYMATCTKNSVFKNFCVKQIISHGLYEIKTLRIIIPRYFFNTKLTRSTVGCYKINHTHVKLYYSNTFQYNYCIHDQIQ